LIFEINKEEGKKDS